MALGGTSVRLGVADVQELEGRAWDAFMSQSLGLK